MFLGLSDPVPLVRGTADPAPVRDPDHQVKLERKTLIPVVTSL
jgi:hypothetical protein